MLRQRSLSEPLTPPVAPPRANGLPTALTQLLAAPGDDAGGSAANVASHWQQVEDSVSLSFGFAASGRENLDFSDFRAPGKSRTCRSAARSTR